MTIKRIWHGWTSPENADKYQDLLHNNIFPVIEAKNISGYQSIELFRRDSGHEVEFVTIMTFDSLQNIIDFQGEDYTRCYVPDAAKLVLKRWDQVSDHYETIEVRKYGSSPIYLKKNHNYQIVYNDNRRLSWIFFIKTRNHYLE